ncbi:nucleotidyl transferase AbiEii/AbiGii toxin family protein [Chamaesiphon minutus]|uniref:Nucleotidyl transferase AbiEii/AbiGii toxin family protein n=1 Tax=Chamaesiphon minutus (strain ATCC 27169 / PCC 6605) TaxID=1173020 RepID=K9UE08_CHAP6|nr:nucleotidyl transferase AbiEii/AbiGii toxin family protein [Chamaesiphon minutus]AFY92439.1 protein of unknown function (DUF1814) [Chamaesiphon minutus PCC 6605]
MLNKLTIDTIDVLARKTRADPSFFEKDWYTTQLLDILSKIQDPRFQLVFSGGTSLSKAYQLIKRFSEDIDFNGQAGSPALYPFRMSVGMKAERSDDCPLDKPDKRRCFEKESGYEEMSNFLAFSLYIHYNIISNLS